MGGFLYYTAARAFTIFTFIWMAAFRAVLCVLSNVLPPVPAIRSGGEVRVSRGVMYNQVDAVYIRNLQYTTRARTCCSG